MVETSQCYGKPTNIPLVVSFPGQWQHPNLFPVQSLTQGIWPLYPGIFDPFIPSIFCYGGDDHCFIFDLAFRDLAFEAIDIQMSV
jgi:hypothetical protein